MTKKSLIVGTSGKAMILAKCSRSYKMCSCELVAH